jgi:hypothetical protein
MSWWMFMERILGSGWHFLAKAGMGGSATTGSACGRIVRFAWREKTPTRKLTPPTKTGVAPCKQAVRVRAVTHHSWCSGTKSLHHSGSEMPSGYPMPPRTSLSPNLAQACWGKARIGRGGQPGVSLVRESCWVSGVLG